MVLGPQGSDPKRDFREAAQRTTVPQEHAPVVQIEAPQAPAQIEEQDIDAERAAFWAMLTDKVRSGKLNKHEAYYEAQRFETEGVRQHTPSADRAGARNSPEQAADDGLMSSYVTEETKAEQRAAEAEHERQRGGRSGGMER